MPQSTAAGIRDGLDAKVRVPEMPGRTFEVKVARNTGALNAASRTLLIEVDVKNADHVLRSGLYAVVDIAVPREAPSVVVPAEAIIFDSDGLRVAVVDDGVAHMHAVGIARDFGTTVELRDGLKGGEQVVLSPPVDLTDGQKVRIQPAQKPVDQAPRPAPSNATAAKS